MTAPIPKLDIIQTDGALQALPGEGVHAKIGVCSAGPLNTAVLIASLAALAAYGTGPVVEATAHQLEVTGEPVLLTRCAAGVAGANGAVVRSGPGSAGTALTAVPTITSTAVPSLTITGVLARAYAVRVRVVGAGADLAASPTTQYSLDGGLTWSTAAIAVAGPTALGTSGISLAWADGSFVASDTWAGYAVAGLPIGGGLLAVTGSPLDAYQVSVRIVRPGASLASNVATYRLSLDGGRTYGDEYAMPVNGVVTPANTGLTLTFTNGGGGGSAFSEGDLFEFRTTAPAPTLSNINAAWAGMLANNNDVEVVHIVGAVDSITATGIASLANAALTSAKPRIVLLEARDQGSGESEAAWMQSLNDDFANFVSDRVGIVAGAAEVYLSAVGRYGRRRAGMVVAARAALVPISEDLAWVARGPLPSVTAIYHDEDANPGLNAGRFITLRQHQGLPGYYITNPLLMAAPDSDFQLLQYRRVWDRAFRVLRRVMLRYLSQDLALNPPGVQAPLFAGGLDEIDAGNIEDAASDALRTALVQSTPRHVTDVTAAVNRTNNVLSTQELDVTFGIQPKGYAKKIVARLGFINPSRST